MTYFIAGPKNAESSNSPENRSTEQRSSVHSPVTITNPSSTSIKDSDQLSSWSSDEPTLRDTFRILYPIAHKWDDIGTLLDIPANELSVIERDKDGAHASLRKMIVLWLNSETSSTWQSLAEAVRVIDHKTASEITKSYKT